jgi:hypothetical protein
LGKIVMLSIVSLWAYRAVTEILLFKIGLDGAWWRFFLFLVLAVIYLIPLVTAPSKESLLHCFSGILRSRCSFGSEERHPFIRLEFWVATWANLREIGKQGRKS